MKYTKELPDIVRTIVLKSDFTADLTDIVENILFDAYLEYDDIDEADMIYALNMSLDTKLIFTLDQWNVMAYYQTPLEANFESAVEAFLEDLEVLFKQLLEEMGKEVR